jgi:hypothetical protein
MIVAQMAKAWISAGVAPDAQVVPDLSQPALGGSG